MSRSGRRVRAATTPSVVLGLLLVAVFAGCRNSAADRLKEEGFLERNPPGIPEEAKLVRHTGEQKTGSLFNPDTWFAKDNVTFKPAHDGRVWVVDEQNATIVQRGRLRAGDELVVEPKTNSIFVNKASVSHARLSDEHGFLIYFAPDAPETQPAGAAPKQP